MQRRVAQFKTLFQLPRITCVVLAAGVAGCSSDPDPFEPWMTLNSPPAESANAEHSSVSNPAASPQAGAALDISLPPDAEAETYVALALRRSPAIRAADLRVRRMAARIEQVQTLDDPMVELAPVGEMAETAAGQVDLMVGVRQRLPWPGTLEAKGHVAGQEVAMAIAELERVKLRIAAQTRRAYWQLYAAAQSLAVTNDSRMVLEQLRAAARARFEAGQAPQSDVLRIEVELAELDRQITRLTQQERTAQAMLNRLLDRPAGSALPAPPAIELQIIELEQRQLLTQAAALHPDLQRLREQSQRYRQQLRLAKLNRLPNFTVGANYAAVDDEGLAMSANGRDQWWLTLGLSLPIWADKYDAAEREAQAGIMESLAALNDQQQQVAFDVQAAWFDLVSRQEQAELFVEQILPRAEQTVSAALASYRAGGGSFIDVTDAWRRQLALELLHEQNLAAVGQALADLREAVGGELPEVSS